MNDVVDTPFCSRVMTEADLPAVMAIEERAYVVPWTPGIMRDCLRVGYHCWVYEQEGELVGYGILSAAMDVGESHILNLCVRPESQGRGLGRRILEHLLEQSKRLGCHLVLLEARPSNPVAIRLYRSAGFEQIGRRKRYYPTPTGREDALVFALDISAAFSGQEGRET